MKPQEREAKHVISPTRRRVYIAIVLSCWLLVLGIIGLKALEYRGDHGLRLRHVPRTRRPMPPGLKGGATHPLFDDDAFVLDDLTYVSPRPGYVAKRISNSISGGKESVFRVTHVEQGIIRHERVATIMPRNADIGNIRTTMRTDSMPSRRTVWTVLIAALTLWMTSHVTG